MAAHKARTARRRARAMLRWSAALAVQWPVARVEQAPEVDPRLVAAAARRWGAVVQRPVEAPRLAVVQRPAEAPRLAAVQRPAEAVQRPVEVPRLAVVQRPVAEPRAAAERPAAEPQAV